MPTDSEAKMERARARERAKNVTNVLTVEVAEVVEVVQPI